MSAIATAECLVKERAMRSEDLDNIRANLGGLKEVLVVNSGNLRKSHLANRLVGRCMLTVSNPVLKVPTGSALETKIS